MSHRFLDNVAIADVCFEAKGKTLKELFESCALAVVNVQVKNYKSIRHKETRTIEADAPDIDMLLFSFLSNLVAYKDSEQLLFNKFNMDIFPEGGKWRMKCEAHGEAIDRKKHNLLVDVKGVTLHLFEVKEERNGWLARVVLDI
jgi:SHS2 domain-containing protein